ncbi:discoidin domain-containing protein [Niabella pedocola]|uniref:galactosylceramidase n=1 Tax=Niabella pedocola TaxID=1752077 RepID=A0ABS8PYT8_9BACT|nr:discoidin domain-containing protein [Niabella pedocola]MCD2425091.1 discoidin domain-containing protein [Niabella pedocola]
MKLYRSVKLLLAGLFLYPMTFTGSGVHAQTQIRINEKSTGRIFDGIGAVSAGGSSKLLIDYAEPQRNAILDYLFKPNFGAGFTYLKTEIGGDGNTTCGSEPSFARTREEMENPNYQRGYEYWLMREAVNRNAHIELDALEWCMPGWFKGVWSMDNANYLLKFIEGAKSWGLNLKYISGCWNERDYNRNWIVDSLRPLLDKNGYENIKINAPEGAGHAWAIADQLVTDSVFRNTLAAISYHYPDSYMHRPGTTKATPNALNSGLPLWSGEDFSLGGKSWNNVLYLAKNIIRCYIGHKIVKVNLWCPIASMPDNVCYSNTGIMKANTPWSGYYEVWPTIWAVGHFNQFVKPGWKYLDDACGTLPDDGVYATYKAPGKNRDYSVVMVSGNSKQKVDLKFDQLTNGVIHVWKSDSVQQFIKQKSIAVKNGILSLELEPRSIYTLTTTTGQVKGNYAMAPEKQFPVRYKDDFNSYALNRAPMAAKYFYDNSGAFEVYQAPGESTCLRQVVNRDIVHWIPDSCAFSFVSQGQDWSDGAITADVNVEEDAFNGPGYAGVMIRGAYDKASQAVIPHGYRLNIYKNGYWRLQTKDAVLASGTTDTKGWHRLKLQAEGSKITAFIDGKMVTAVSDQRYILGAAGFVSGWNRSRFDNLEVNYQPLTGRLVSELKTVESSSGSYDFYVVDGNSYTPWFSQKNGDKHWLMVDLGKVYDISRSVIYFSGLNSALNSSVSVSSDKVRWTPAASGKQFSRGENCTVLENGGRARYLRVEIDPGTQKEHQVGIHEWYIYSK